MITLSGVIPIAATPVLHIGSIAITCSSVLGASFTLLAHVTCLTPAMPIDPAAVAAITVDDVQYITPVFEALPTTFLVYREYSLNSTSPRRVYLHEPTQVR